MPTEMDALIRKAQNLETQIEQLATELAHLRETIATRMGTEREYYGQGVIAKKWARVRWEINKALLLDELSPEALAYLKEVVFSKAKLEQAIKAGHLPPRLYDRAVKKIEEGWNVSVKVLETPGPEPDWELEDDLRQ